MQTGSRWLITFQRILHKIHGKGKRRGSVRGRRKRNTVLRVRNDTSRIRLHAYVTHVGICECVCVCDRKDITHTHEGEREGWCMGKKGKDCRLPRKGKGGRSTWQSIIKRAFSPPLMHSCNVRQPPDSFHLTLPSLCLCLARPRFLPSLNADDSHTYISNLLSISCPLVF